MAKRKRWKKKPKLRMLVVGLSSDKKGLLVRNKTMAKDAFWHVHSDELTPYQRQVRGWLTNSSPPRERNLCI